MMTKKELQTRIQEVEKDLAAFAEARSVVHQRILVLEGNPHYEFLHDWAGTQALMNVFVMVITRCEGLLEDMKKNLDDLPADQPAFRLVRGTEDE